MTKLSMSEEEMLKRKYTRPYEKRIAELEKENAEMKSDLNEKENTIHTLDVLHKEAVRKYGEVNDRLTKAKDILRMIVYWKSDKKELLNFINKAEQFIKDSEVEK